MTEQSPETDILVATRVREGSRTDYQFVLDTWLESFVRFWVFRSKPDIPKLKRELNEVLDRLLLRSQLRIADHNGRVIGWALVDLHEPLVHYAYVLRPLRRIGICRALLSDLTSAPWRYAHDSALAAAAAPKLGGTFDPYAEVLLQPTTENA